MMTDEQVETECKYCHYTNVTDDWFYGCDQCGSESCADCAGRCGCEIEPDLITTGKT